LIGVDKQVESHLTLEWVAVILGRIDIVGDIMFSINTTVLAICLRVAVGAVVHAADERGTTTVVGNVARLITGEIFIGVFAITANPCRVNTDRGLVVVAEGLCRVEKGRGLDRVVFVQPLVVISQMVVMTKAPLVVIMKQSVLSSVAREKQLQLRTTSRSGRALGKPTGLAILADIPRLGTDGCCYTRDPAH
jgi:hypothetical protein